MFIHFGKYRNQDLNDVFEKDKKYIEWLITQPWFKIKFKELHHQTLHLLNEKNKEPIQVDNKSTIIYTDGACPHNGSKKARMGIGVYFSKKNKISIPSVSSSLMIDKPTNNRAELSAIEKALRLCKENNISDKIIIYTDSEYSIKSITLWYPDWLMKNKLKDKKNVDLLEMIHLLYSEMDVKLNHIRSHTGLTDEHSKGNEMADRLAVESLK